MGRSAHGNYTWAGTTFQCIVGVSRRCFEASRFICTKRVESQLTRVRQGVLWTTNSYRSPLNHDNRMCGIAGPLNFKRPAPVERETIVRMAHSIAHRGPDDEGFFIAGPVGLGFRRLSISDLA